MPAADTALSFFGLALLLSFAPGPDNIFVMLQSATHGRRAGLWVVLGLCTGLVGHTVAVALGLAAVFAASVTAFNLLKMAGAAYLTWLAWQALRAPATPLSTTDAPLPGARGMYLRGVIMNLTNPKVAIFFLALLPQFVQAERDGVTVQILWLGALFIGATLLAFGLITWFAASLGALLRRSANAQRWMNRLTGIAFLGLAARLATAQR